MQARFLETLADECAARRAWVLVTDIDSGEQRVVRPDEPPTIRCRTSSKRGCGGGGAR
jgi:hypothetical protein